MNEDATKGRISAGRSDMQSYHGLTGEPFTNVYHDTISDRTCDGIPLPMVICKAVGAQNKEIAARIVACWNGCAAIANPQWIPDLVVSLRSLIMWACQQNPNAQDEAMLARMSEVVIKAEGGV